MKRSKIIWFSLLFVAVLGISYIVYLVKTMPEFQAGEIIATPPKDYLDMFQATTRNKLCVDYVLKPKYDNVICQYSYGDSLLVQQHAIAMLNDLPLSEVIAVENADDLKTNGTISNEIRTTLFTVSYKTFFPKIIHLKVSLNGDAIKTVALNDTVACFSSTIKNFSIKYNHSDTSAIFCQLQSSYDNDKPVPAVLPINIMFIKKQKTIYFLVMSIIRPNVYLKPDMLYNLVFDKQG